MGDGRSLARIARAVQVERPAMTNTIQKLEARGLVRVAPIRAMAAASWCS